MKYCEKYLLFFLIVLTEDILLAQQNYDCRKLYFLNQTLQQHHYRPVQLNDTVSEELFNSFIKALDPLGIYFTIQDTIALSKYRFRLDDEIIAGRCNFLKDFTILYRNALIQAEQSIEKILEVPLNFKDNEFFKISDSLLLPDETSYTYHLTKWLKFQALHELFIPKDSTENPLNEEYENLLKKEKSIRAKVLFREKQKINRILNHHDSFENYIYTLFLNVLTNRFDPHTSYMSASQNENFKADLSKKSMLFGFTLAEKSNGEIYIERISPGSAAWKSNALHKGDVLLAFQWPQKAPVDIRYASLYEVSELLSESLEEKICLTIRKNSGLIQEVSLIREQILNEDNIISSFILERRKKIGYISMPSFYSEWDDESPLGCANDVAKEILKLKKENIEGLIMDLRNNSGGSLIEAVNLIGIFIDQGPLFTIDAKGENPYVIQDRNRGMAYDGPLIILINGLSASASELVAATLQDLNRALIIGSNTYGKASGQSILHLGPQQNSPISTLGYVKLTDMLLYRIDGQSHQQIGVKPDITLPSILDHVNYLEAYQSYSLTPIPIQKDVKYYKHPAIPVNKILEKSNLRVENDSVFANIKKLSLILGNVFNSEKNIPLEIHSYKNRIALNQGLIYSLGDNYEVSASDIRVKIPKLNEDYLHLDKLAEEFNNFKLNEIKNNIYIAESLSIMEDLIEISNKN